MRSTPDGTLLATRRWVPPGDQRSTIVLVHGLGEHLGRYDHVGSALATRGHQVMGSDLRGHGRSGGRRAFIHRWEQFLDDLEGDIASARGRSGPVILMGHSLGGLIAASYVTEGRAAPDLLVLSAPAVDDDLSAARKKLATLLGRMFPRLTLANGIRGSQLSRDPSVGERYFADPLVLTKTTLGFAREAIMAQARVRATLSLITLPTLVIHSAVDTVVPPRASARFHGMDNVTRVVFPDFRHESFNEEGGTLAIGTVADWIESRL